jgi:hypothetical protein
MRQQQSSWAKAQRIRSPQNRKSQLEKEIIMSDVVGEWSLHISRCDGTYYDYLIAFRNDGIFNLGGYLGHWGEVNGTVMFQFNDTPTTYAGNRNGFAIVGAWGVFASSNYGCWYAIKKSPSPATAAPLPPIDPTGKELDSK